VKLANFLQLGRAKRTSTPFERHGRLAFRAGRLRSADDAAVMLRGVSLFWSQWAPEFYNQRLVHWLAEDWAVDILRIAVAATSPGYLSDPKGEIGKAKTIIDAAISTGIYVLLDWHGHDLETEAARTLFRAIASAYGDCPNIMYETWNEPHSRYSWNEDILPHHLTTLATIREFAPRAPVIWASQDFAGRPDLVAEASILHANVGCSLHFYAGTHREGLRMRTDEALAKGAAVLATEWGLGESDGSGTLDKLEAERWLQFLRARRIGYINWSICDKAETCAALLPGCSADGGWRRSHLSVSGSFVRDDLRRVC